MDDYQPEKKEFKFGDSKRLEFILMNKARFQKIKNEKGYEVFGNYTLQITYSSSYTEGIVFSNILEFEIREEN